MAASVSKSLTGSETKILVVDYALAAPEELPTLSEVKYVASRGDFVEKHLPESQHVKLYDDVIYQITLRVVRAVVGRHH